MANARTEVLQVMVTADERQAIEQAASNMGMTISGYCRFVLLFDKKEEK